MMSKDFLPMLKKLWVDPVWSKVISAGIIGLISIGASAYIFGSSDTTAQRSPVIKTAQPTLSPIDASAQRTPDKSPQPTLQPIDTPYSQMGLSERSRLRSGLRSLTVAESGRLASKLPSSIYGYAHPLILSKPDIEMDRVPRYGKLSFEAQKTANGVLLVLAFVNLDVQASLARDGKVTVPITLYSDYWDEAKYPVLVVASSCKGRDRSVDLDGGSHVTAVDCEPVLSKAPTGASRMP
jgi:hypothetical protein